jgi:hypothetical protein
MAMSTVLKKSAIKNSPSMANATSMQFSPTTPNFFSPNSPVFAPTTPSFSTVHNQVQKMMTFSTEG